SSLPPKTAALMTETLYLLPHISWWLADGRYAMYESINCPRMHATILDIYMAPVMAALFPGLHARAMRNIANAQLESGEIPSTLGIQSITHREYRTFSPGDVSVFPITTVWEMLWGGDPEFVADLYPVIKKTLKWGKSALDEDGDGVPDTHGIDQGWDTFPMQGGAAYIADQWIAGLLAGQTMARRLGDTEFSAWCESALKQATDTAENKLWNGSYYDLFYNPATGERSDISFADQFTYGQLAATILELGDVHPKERVRKALESLWRLNVETCNLGARMGSRPDGSPADSTSHKPQEGGDSQSNSFTPVSTGPLAAVAMQHGMVEQGLALAEQMSQTILDHVKEPWSGKLLFSSKTGDCFYGYDYSDCLIVWDIMYALLGAHVNMLDRTLKLAPARVPVKVPLLTRLYYGQIEFAEDAGSVSLTLTSASDKPTLIDQMTVCLPEGSTVGKATVAEGQVRRIEQDGAASVLAGVAMGPRGRLTVRWPRAS
ncbi:MAG: hypothetical protein HY321_10415, partial [Armatimonadetes bacterium]|nr:hypothetical protein [Armatimonadota bacterium]